MILNIFFALLGIFNLYTFLLMAYDKHCARKGKLRIPEARFFQLSFFGGSLGVLFAMPIFRHKNRKWSFKGKIYSISGGQVLLFIFLWRYVL